MGQAESQHEKFWEACGYGETRLVEHYIKQGVDVNWISMTHKCRPIHAAACKKPEIIKLLVEAGCDVNALDEAGRTALHHAAMKGYTECATLLLDYGTEVDQRDKNGWTALHCAAYWGHPETIQVLLDHDADITITNKDSRLALHEACRGKSDEPQLLADCVRKLVEVGCETNIAASGEGTLSTKFTPLMFACYHGYLEVVKVLVEAGCDLDTMGTNGWTAIHWAAEQERKSICQYLLEAGVNRYTPNDRNETALERAKSESLKDLLLNTFPHDDPRQNPVPRSIPNKRTQPTEPPAKQDTCETNEAKRSVDLEATASTIKHNTTTDMTASGDAKPVAVLSQTKIENEQSIVAKSEATTNSADLKPVTNERAGPTVDFDDLQSTFDSRGDDFQPLADQGELECALDEGQESFRNGSSGTPVSLSTEATRDCSEPCTNSDERLNLADGVECLNLDAEATGNGGTAVELDR